MFQNRGREIFDRCVARSAFGGKCKKRFSGESVRAVMEFSKIRRRCVARSAFGSEKIANSFLKLLELVSASFCENSVV